VKDKRWKQFYAPLSDVKMSDQARNRVLEALDRAAEPGFVQNRAQVSEGQPLNRRQTAASGDRSGRLRKVAWWAGTGVVAAALATFALLGGPGRSPVPPVQPAAPGPGTAQAVSEPLVSVQMVNGQAGWARAQNGHVLRTDDGGVTWRDVSPDDLEQVDPSIRPYLPFFLPDDAQAAWLLDMRTETVYRTTDGGKTWQKGKPPKLDLVNDGGVSMAFASETEGWLLVSTGAHNQGGQLFQTTDGGLTWQSVAISGKGGLPYGGMITFSRAVKGLGWLLPDPMVAGGEPRPLMVTHDGGKTWAPQQLTFPSDYAGQIRLGLPQFASRNIAKDGPGTNGLEGILSVTLMSGKYNSALIYVTRDGGLTWTQAGKIENAGSGMGQSTDVADAITFWDYVPDGNTLWSTTDGGKSWNSFNPQPSLYDPQHPGPDGLMAMQIDFVSQDEGWAVVNGSLLHTKDGGRTWATLSQAEADKAPVAQPPVPPAGKPLALSTFKLADGEHGWAVRYGEKEAALLRTTDGGRTWTDTTPPGASAEGVFGVALWPAGADGLWAAVGGTSHLVLYHTEDGGAKWQATPVQTIYTNNVPVRPVAFSFVDAKHGWLMLSPDHGMNSMPGELLATQDGGITWNEVAHDGSGLPFNGQISFTNKTDGWLVGSETTTTRQYLYHTADGGRSWSKVDLPVPASVPGGSVNDIGLPTPFGSQMLLPVTFEVSGKGISSGGVYHSADGGVSWQFAGGLIPDPVLPTFVTAAQGFALSWNGLYSTANGGASWKTVDAGRLSLLVKGDFNPQQISFVSPTVGWVLLHPKRAGETPQLLKTVDGGQSWTNLAASISQK
jgi:photosystem II stability/assembly factor-like uncharacterized protein